MGVADQVLKHVKLPFPGKLHEYQLEDLDFLPMLTNCAFYWDLGLGKSVAAAITGGYKLLRDEAEVVIVLAPASLGQQWYEMLNKMGFATLWYAGLPNKRMRTKIDHDFVVMSYEIFQKDYDRLKLLKKPYFIVDEATILCNSQNVMWKMLNGGIISKTKKVPGKLKPEIIKVQYPKINQGCCLLTATPTNKPTDAYGLIKTVSPDIYQNYNQFMNIHVGELDFFGAPKTYNHLDLLHDNLKSSASIRAASDHLDLPEKVYNIIEYDLDKAHYEMYAELMNTRMLEIDGEIQINALQATALYNYAQKIILNPDEFGYKKDAKGIEILDTIVNGSKQILIFNKYVMTNDKMLKRYDKLGVGGCYGEISRSQQNKFIAAFQARELRVLSCNIKSGGYGLNLQICNQAVFPEIPITARDQRQAEGRVWRQGQKERVVFTILIARRTIQQSLLKRVMANDDINQEVFPTPRSLRQDLFGG